MAAAILLSSAIFAAPPEKDPSKRAAEIKRIVSDLHYQQGEINLGGGLAKLSVPPEYNFLDGRQAELVLHDLWGNPPSEQGLGMLMPAEMSPVDKDGWAIEVHYEEEGYVKDDEAATLNYDDLLKKMQEQTVEANKEREKEGYPALTLVGWATPPRYDQATHKLYWAKELEFEGHPKHVLNYNIRILGRKGVLVLNAIADMDRLADVEAATPTILKMVNFQEGSRYTDYKVGDKVATYGLIGLIAGGVLAKAGGFKLLLAGLLAAKKFVIIGVVAIAGWFKKLMANLRGQRQEPPVG